MSQTLTIVEETRTIYDTYSRNLRYAKKKNSWLFKLSFDSLQKRFKLPSRDAAKKIHIVRLTPSLSKPVVLASLLAYAKHIHNDAFWNNFQLTAQYIFSEFARQNFFPIVYNRQVESLRNTFALIIGKERHFNRVLEIVHPKAIVYEDILEYLSWRARGKPEYLAKIIIASLIIPKGLFDWKSISRGEDPEQLMMFGLEAMDQKEFDKLFPRCLESHE
jgi:hypothetical protein